MNGLLTVLAMKSEELRQNRRAMDTEPAELNLDPHRELWYSDSVYMAWGVRA